MLADRAAVRGSVKARPAGTWIEFGLGTEQGRVATDAAIRAGVLLLVIGVAESPLGAVLPRHVELLGRKLAAPLLFRPCDLGLIGLSGKFSLAHRWNTFGSVRIYSVANVANIVIGDARPKRALRRS